MRKRILYVDDEKMNLLLFEANLKDKFEIVTAEGAIEALKIIEEKNNFEVVISDMKMPLMNGVEFIKNAKLKLQNARYYILTGYGMTDEIKNALNNNLILKKLDKPLNISEILTEIEK